MSEQEAQPSADVPAAPPTVRTGKSYKPVSAWPTTIGVICIVFGAFAIINGGFGVLGPLVMQSFAGSMGPMVPALSGSMLIGTIALAVVGGGLGLMLLVAGIGITQRRHWSKNLSRAWAVLKILFALGSSWMGYMVQQAQMQAVQQQMPTGGPPLAVFSIIGALGFLIGVAWYAALPVFILAWFSWRSVRAETGEWR